MAVSRTSVPIIDNEFCHNIVKVVCSCYFDNFMTKFMINNMADAWITDNNLLIALLLFNISSRALRSKY